MKEPEVEFIGIHEENLKELLNSVPHEFPHEEHLETIPNKSQNQSEQVTR